MEKKKVVLVASLILAISVGAYVRKKEIEPCTRIRAELELSQNFCLGIGKKFAGKNCLDNGIDDKNMAACVDLLTQVIASDCMSALDLSDEISKYENFCQ